MKKFLKLSAILIAVMSVLFLGCSSGGSDGPGTEPEIPVTSISVLINNYTENDPYTLFEGDDVKLTAQILPGNATNKGYSLEVIEGEDDVVTLDADGTLTAVAEGTAKVKITSAGKKADGEFATSTFGFVVTNDPELITNIRLLVHNQNKPTDPATTTTAVLNNDNRYVIVNNEADAQVTNTRADVRGNTILYINKPLKMPKNEDDSYTPYSISGRIKITGTRTTGQPATGGNYGVITGIFTNPKIPVTAATPLKFVGARSAAHGRKQMYITRDATNNDNSSSGFTLATENGITIAPGLDLEDSATTKVQGFKEQEYIFKVVRTTSAIYDLKIFSADGETELASGQRGKDSGNNLATILQSENEYLYLGFIISGVTAEISDVVVKNGDTEIFRSSTPAATPYPQPILKTSITTAKVEPGDGYDYQCMKAAFPTTGVQLAASVLPIDADQTITWSISLPGADATVTSGGLVTATGAGPFTVKAQSAGAAFAEYKFNIYDQVPPVTSITVKGPNSVMAGNGSGVTGNSIEMLTSVEPVIAEETADITWSVKAEDGTSDTTAATINASTGALKATDSDITEDTVVKVFASSSKGAGGTTVTSAGYAVTIKKYTSSLSYVLKTKYIGTVPNNATNSNSYDTAAAKLTVNGDGVVSSTLTNFNFVYAEIPNEDFVATVNVHSFTAQGSDNSKAGLWALFIDPATVTASTAVTAIQYLHVGLNNTANALAEMRRLDSTGNAGRTPFDAATTTTAYPKMFRITYTKTTNKFLVAISNNNGTNWTDGTERTYTVSGDKIYLGLGVSSNNVSTHGSAIFSDFVINGTAVDLSQTITAP